MSLSTDLISQFVKATNDNKRETKKDTITYGTVFKKDGQYQVKLDGSDITMPVSISQLSSGIVTDKETSTARVVVLIKNHTAIILASLEPQGTKVTTLDGIELELKAIDEIKADNIIIKNTLTAHKGTIDILTADNVTINNTLKSIIADIEYLDAHFITAEDIKATYATIENLNSINTYIYNLEATYGEFKDLTTEKLDAHQAVIDELGVTYANIDFANIGKAAIEHLFAMSGLIENIVVGDGTITGTLVGVTIKGDLIEGNTVVADKLVIKGEDGLYYKLNTDGVTTEAEQTEYNSLNGSVITAKSITATQISVSDLVAFDATIGGFNITENSIYSEVKDDEGNTTRGIYMDTDGQINFGDENNFIKYYRDESGNYKLAISAESIMYALNGKQHSIADIGRLGEYVHIGTYEGEPCIELGEGDSDFKLIITNTRIMFMEGTSVPAYINNQSLHITKAVIEEEIQQGEFVWKVRANGNMGLMWKGGV